MDKIKWCCKQKTGIRLVEPNDRLANKYIEDEDSDFLQMKKASGKWREIMAYYACYEALYAILQKYGIKCEIHDRSIELIKFIEKLKIFRDFVTALKKERINIQYYLKPPKGVDENKVSEFILVCKETINELNDDSIKEFRSEIEKYL